MESIASRGPTESQCFAGWFFPEPNAEVYFQWNLWWMFKRFQKPSVVEDVHLMCICMNLPMKVLSSKPLKTTGAWCHETGLPMGKVCTSGWRCLKQGRLPWCSMMFHDKIIPEIIDLAMIKYGIWMYMARAQLWACGTKAGEILGEVIPHILLVPDPWRLPVTPVSSSLGVSGKTTCGGTLPILSTSRREHSTVNHNMGWTWSPFACVDFCLKLWHHHHATILCAFRSPAS